MRKTAFFILLLLFSLVFGKSLKGQIAAADTIHHKNTLFIYPVIYYTPETRLGFGGTANYFFRKKGSSIKTRPSSVIPVLIYTLNKQIISQLDFDHYWNCGKNHFYSQIEYVHYPDKFYGIGNQTETKNREDYTSETFGMLLRFLKKVRKGLYLGIQYDYFHDRLTETDESGRLTLGVIPGSQGAVVSEISAIVNRDTRDNVYNASKGVYCYASAGIVDEFLGSHFNYTHLKLELRHYIPLFKTHVLALRSIGEFQPGNPPFQKMTKIGGSVLMRGYYEGRYRDKNMAAFEMEYRLPLWWRTGLVGFAGIGDVAHSIKDFSLQDFKLSYGFGFRFMFDPKERLNLRVDFGFGEDSSGIYFGAVEVF